MHIRDVCYDWVRLSFMYWSSLMALTVHHLSTMGFDGPHLAPVYFQQAIYLHRFPFIYFLIKAEAVDDAMKVLGAEKKFWR